MKAKLVGVFFFGWALGLLSGALLPTTAAQGGPTQKTYEVIDENNGGKIREELNRIVRTNQTCTPVLAIAPNDYGKSKVIVECLEPMTVR